MQESSPTVLLDTVTGKRVPHWTELDHSSDGTHPDGYQRSLLIWPAKRLEDSRRYIVALRDLKTTYGNPVVTSPGWTALRDNTSSTDVTIETRRGHYEKAIFPALSTAGVKREDLQLAWDFTVGSSEQFTGRILSMREDAFQRVEEFDFTFTVVKENPRKGVARQLQGLMTVPWYLNEAAPGATVRLNVDETDINKVNFNGYKEIAFMIIVPESVVNGSKGMLLQVLL